MDVAKSVLTEFMTDEKVITTSMGRVEIIPYEVVNESKTTELYTIKIEDPDERMLSRPELEIISVPNEWQYWVETLNYV